MYNRQLMSVNGFPVQVIESSSDIHGNLVSLCMGDITTPRKLRQEYDLAASADFETLRVLDQIIHGRAIDHLQSVDPELHGAYLDRTKLVALASQRSVAPNDLSINTSNIIFLNYTHQLETTPEGFQLRDIKTRIKDLEESKLYEFVKETSGVLELPVGSQAVLVYKKEEARSLKLALKKILEEFDWEKGYYGHYLRKDGEQIYRRISEVIQILEGEKSVGFIPQIEVLPKYKRQGLTKGLLDVATFLIEQGKGQHEVTWAKVMHEKPDRFRMIDIFERAGYEEIVKSADIGMPSYSLMIRTKKPMIPVAFDYSVLK